MQGLCYASGSDWGDELEEIWRQHPERKPEKALLSDSSCTGETCNVVFTRTKHFTRPISMSLQDRVHVGGKVNHEDLVERANGRGDCSCRQVALFGGRRCSPLSLRHRHSTPHMALDCFASSIHSRPVPVSWWHIRVDGEQTWRSMRTCTARYVYMTQLQTAKSAILTAETARDERCVSSR